MIYFHHVKENKAMTLEEAIKQNEEKGEKYKVLSLTHEPYLMQDVHQYSRCSDEYFQIAEWLKELKKLREEREVATVINVGTTIYRQAAIGTVKKHYRVDNDLLEVIVYELENLPSAQPPMFETKLDGSESDVEILSKLRCQFNCFDEKERPWYEALSRAIKALRLDQEYK